MKYTRKSIGVVAVMLCMMVTGCLGGGGITGGGGGGSCDEDVESYMELSDPIDYILEDETTGLDVEVSYREWGKVYCDKGDSYDDEGVVYDTPGGGAYEGSPDPSDSGDGAGSLKGGEWNDHENFEEYLEWANNYSDDTVHKFEAENRIIIQVKNRNGNSIPNADIVIFDDGSVQYIAKSDSRGEAVFFPQLLTNTRDSVSFNIEVDKNGVRTDSSRSVSGADVWEIGLDAEDSKLEVVDIAFLLDTTGSMADEIARIQTTLKSIVDKVSDADQNIQIRLGLVVYRDRGDEYITETYDFVTDVDEFQSVIDDVQAGGGADYEESVNEGLHVAVSQLDWSQGEAIRMLFLIADAPPHLDYEQDFEYLAETVLALRRGIKIYPVAASGLDEKGEFIFRQMSLMTMSKFVFISYDGTTPHHVGEYQENNLDDIIVDTITDEIDSYGSSSVSMQ